MKELDSGIVQLIYEKLSIRRQKNKQPLFAFWDNKCLNYGQDWEHGFIAGLRNSQVIVLLVSNKVCSKFLISNCIFYLDSHLFSLSFLSIFPFLSFLFLISYLYDLSLFHLSLFFFPLTKMTGS
jgi:hypothetical protein